jgi:TetR/AcrR family transcriptional repressor of nem operon
MSPSPVDRRSEVLAHSRALLRTRGFNAFSHRDLAALAGVKSSSIHYHFPSKEDIGLALIEDYRTEIMTFLSGNATLLGASTSA